MCASHLSADCLSVLGTLRGVILVFRINPLGTQVIEFVLLSRD
jgi:hypothetical protein